MSLPACTSGQLPYQTYYAGNPYIHSGSNLGATAQAVCDHFMASGGETAAPISFKGPTTDSCTATSGSTTYMEIEHVCDAGSVPEPDPDADGTTINCGAQCTVIHRVELDASAAVAQMRTQAIAEVQDPSTIGLTSELAAKSLFAGFAAVLGMFVIGYAVAVGLGLIKRV